MLLHPSSSARIKSSARINGLVYVDVPTRQGLLICATLPRVNSPPTAGWVCRLSDGAHRPLGVGYEGAAGQGRFV